MNNEFKEYYKILGLNPGADTEEVKRAFRSKIKQHHPDTSRTPEESEEARRLIEAYHALKNGPPVSEVFRREETPSRNGAGERARQAPHRNRYPAFSFGRVYGRRLYEEVFGSPGRAASGGGPAGTGGHARGTERAPGYDRAGGTGESGTATHDWWEALSRRLHEEAGANIFGGDSNVDEYVDEYIQRQSRKGRSDTSSSIPGSLDQALHYFNRAEQLLREVVKRYDDSRGLKRRTWIREYLAGLNNVQVLFRDVANRHPILSTKALNRVRQISELSAEIRQML